MESKPKTLDIRAEDVPVWNGTQRCLVGRDERGIDWVIRWCGNGSYSHWCLYKLGEDLGTGWYEFIYNGPEYEREKRQSLLEKQIREAEKKYSIYF